MKKGFFRRIFVAYAVVLIVAVVFVEIYITSAVGRSYREDLKKGLLVRISLISSSGLVDSF